MSNGRLFNKCCELYAQQLNTQSGRSYNAKGVSFVFEDKTENELKSWLSLNQKLNQIRKEHTQ